MPTVMIVDDDPRLSAALRFRLEQAGYRVRSACSGQDFLVQLEMQRPDLILLDLMMPEETGTGLYRKLHDRKEYKGIPVIVISAAAGRDDAVSKSVPVFDKPIDKDGLLAAIQKAIGVAAQE